MKEGSKKIQRSSRLSGTAILSTLAIVFDYVLKFSGFKLPFPWMPFLMFDFTGVPIIMALFLFDTQAALTVSLIAGLGMFARSGNWIGASMRIITEAITVLGFNFGMKLMPGSSTLRKYIQSGTSLLLRVIGMTLLNLYVLPRAYGYSLEYVIGTIPLVGLFNLLQGGISIFLGYLLFEAYQRRVPR